MFVNPRNRKHLDQERLRKISFSSATIAAGSRKPGRPSLGRDESGERLGMGGVRVGVGTGFDHKLWTVRAGRNLSHLAQIPHFIDKKNKVSRVKEPSRG